MEGAGWRQWDSRAWVGVNGSGTAATTDGVGAEVVVAGPASRAGSGTEGGVNDEIYELGPPTRLRTVVAIGGVETETTTDGVEDGGDG
ncbi:hypothetical protein GUJ93_ZPchr0006g40645 [Zizania palustris]|uniref:Uncharacterized protein n=1 Tax=Zizania palustris TaxID=103762 RepID=A0A8J5W4H1_ZIZPA|nr:hypothetical protein GUJ93_ZPchr0006g40645 [Zizania palustris]